MTQDVGYVDASHDFHLDANDVGRRRPHSNASDQSLELIKDSAADTDVVDPFVARVRIVDDDSLSTTDNLNYIKSDRETPDVTTNNWNDCKPATITIFGNDGETDCGPEVGVVDT